MARLHGKLTNVILDVQFNAATTPWPELRDAVLAAQEAGYGVAWVLDHLAGQVMRGDQMLECFTWVGALAASTTTIGIGTLVANVWNRPVAVLAAAAASAQIISNGRFWLGIGAGASPASPFGAEHAAVGIALHPDMARRHARVQEFIDMSRTMWAAGAHRIVDFGIDKPAAVSGGYVLKNLSSEIQLRTPAGDASATLAIPGLHNVRNALAACACAHAVGIAPAVMGRGLDNFRPYTGRLQVKRALNGATVIDDTYNANPDSVRAAIDVLARCAPPTVLVLGDMGEVGEQAAEFHREVGAYARSRNVSSLCAFGAQTGEAVAAFGAAGSHAGSIEQLLERVHASATPQATLLIKGSRFMRMERVVNALTGEMGGAH